MLSLAIKHRLLRTHGGPGWQPLVAPDQLCAGMAYSNHPVALWVRQTYGNALWTFRHAKALAEEYERRFGRVHGSAQRLAFLWRWLDIVPAGSRQRFANCTRHRGLQLDFTHMPTIDGYRHYLAARWKTDKRPVQFTTRTPPKWAEYV